MENDEKKNGIFVKIVVTIIIIMFILGLVVLPYLV